MWTKKFDNFLFSSLHSVTSVGCVDSNLCHFKCCGSTFGGIFVLQSLWISSTCLSTLISLSSPFSFTLYLQIGFKNTAFTCACYTLFLSSLCLLVALFPTRSRLYFRGLARTLINHYRELKIWDGIVKLHSNGMGKGARRDVDVEKLSVVN